MIVHQVMQLAHCILQTLFALHPCKPGYDDCELFAMASPIRCWLKEYTCSSSMTKGSEEAIGWKP